MHQRGGLQGHSRPGLGLAGDAGFGKLAQLVVDYRQQLVGRTGVAVLGRLQHAGDVVRRLRLRLGRILLRHDFILHVSPRKSPARARLYSHGTELKIKTCKSLASGSRGDALIAGACAYETAVIA